MALFRRKKGGSKVGNLLRRLKPKKKKQEKVFIPTKQPKKSNVKKELDKIKKSGGSFQLQKPKRSGGGSSGGGSSSSSRAREQVRVEDLRRREEQLKASKELSARIKASADAARRRIEAAKVREFLETKQKIEFAKKVKVAKSLRKIQLGKDAARRDKAIENAERTRKLFAESEFKIAQAGVNAGRLTVEEANARLQRSAIVIDERINKQLLRQSGVKLKLDKSPRKTSGVTIGRKTTIAERANLIRNSNLTANQIENSIVVMRNGEKFIESPGFDFSLKSPDIPRGQRVSTKKTIFQKGKDALTKLQTQVKTGTTTRAGERVAAKYKPAGRFTSKFIKQNPRVTNALLTQTKLTDKIIAETRIGGLEITKTLIDGVEFGKDAIKFLTINNPGWNKETRNSISKGIIQYTPVIGKWIKDVVTDKEKRKLAALGVAGFATKQFKLAKVSPGRSIGRIGGEFLLFFAATGGWKAVKKVDISLTRGFVKVGSKWVRQSSILTGIIKKSGKVIRKVSLVGNNLIVSTTKVIKKPAKFISKTAQKLKVKQLNVKIKKAIKVAQKSTKKKLTITQKISIAKQVRIKARGRVFIATEKKALRRTLAQRDRLIKGVKVGKKEFKSFQSGQKKLDRIIKERAFGTKISSKGGAGVSQRVPKKPISKVEKDLIKSFREIPNVLKSKADKVSINVISQKFGVKIPTLKRTKRGLWEVVDIEKIFYQNTVSVSMFNKAGKGLGTISWNTLASKPVGNFRSVSSALKWGRNKSVVISRQVDKKFVQSIILKSKRGKISRREFISEFKVEVKTITGNKPGVINLIEKVKETRIVTKKVRGFGKVAKKFKKGDIVSRSRVRSKKVKQKGKLGKLAKKERGVLRSREVITRGKTIEQLQIKSKLQTVQIDTSRVQNIINKLNKIKVSNLSKAHTKMVRMARINLRIALKKGGRTIRGRKVLFINSKKLKQANAVAKRFKGRDVVQLIKRKSKPFRPTTAQRGKSKLQLKQIKKVSNDLEKGRGLRESLSAASIPPEIKLRRVVIGALQKKKVMKAKGLIQNILRTSGRRGLSKSDIASLVATVRLIGLVAKQINLLNTATTTTQINNVITKVATIQKKIVATVTRTTTTTSRIITPILTPITPIRPRTPKKPRPPKKPPIIRHRKSEDEETITKTLKKPTRVFNVVIKKRGRNVILNKRLIERDAQNFMALELDTTLIRTARLVPAGVRKVVTKLPRKYAGAFTKRKKKFRTFRIKRKKKISIRGYIEKRKYSLDTKRERLQLGRLIKRGKKKRKTIKRKTTRTTRRKKKRK